MLCSRALLGGVAYGVMCWEGRGLHIYELPIESVFFVCVCVNDHAVFLCAGVCREVLPPFQVPLGVARLSSHKHSPSSQTPILSSTLDVEREEMKCLKCYEISPR